MDALTYVNTSDTLDKIGKVDDSASAATLFGALANLDMSNYTSIYAGALTYNTAATGTWYTAYSLTGKKGFITRCMANRLYPGTGAPSVGKLRITIDGVVSEFCVANSTSTQTGDGSYFGGIINPSDAWSSGSSSSANRIGEFLGILAVGTGGVNSLPYVTSKTPASGVVDVYTISNPLWFKNSLTVEVLSSDTVTAGFILSIKGAYR